MATASTVPSAIAPIWANASRPWKGLKAPIAAAITKNRLPGGGAT